MIQQNVFMALFREDELERATEAVERLRSLGIRHRDISVISGVPYSEKILGRPMTWTRIPLIALAGAGAGFTAAVGLLLVANLQYPLRTAHMQFSPIPTSIVVVYELTMLGLLISTFLGVFIETISPSFGPKGYHPKISDGHIGILFSSPPKLRDRVASAMTELGAEFIDETEIIKP